MAGSVGGFNAHATNMVAAVYIATGQVQPHPHTIHTCVMLCHTCMCTYSRELLSWFLYPSGSSPYSEWFQLYHTDRKVR